MSRTNIMLSHVTKYYDGKPVLYDLNFNFQSGKSYCVMAPSGFGKTTLFRIIMGLEKPDAGTVSTVSPSREARACISAVFQEDRLLPGYSALENIRFVTGKQFSDAGLRQILSCLLPQDSLNKPVSEFSGGMKRRLSILRALLVPSDILLMDEPFSGLDPETKQTAISLIRRYQSGRLLLLTTHAAEDAALLGAEIFRLPSPPSFFHEIP